MSEYPQNRKKEALFDIDISDWDGVSPYQLMNDPYLLSQKPIFEAAPRALKYARAGGSDHYDEIGFRSSAATPTKGAVPLQTVGRMRLEQESEDRKQISPESEALIEVHEKLRHSPLDLPDGHYKYQITDNRIDCVLSSDSYDVWSFSRTAPPSFALHDLEDRDLSQSLTQRLSVDIPCSLWLPVTVLIETGRFKRMQDWTHVLSCKTAPGCFYYFVSHRWLTTSHPDPSGTQARFIAWQLFSHLCKAVQIAHLRGLHAPRRFSKHLGFVLGFHGSDLAESLLVNVLRYALNSSSTEEAAREVATIESNGILDDYGVAKANDKASLQSLHEILKSSPILSHLMSRIFLWYDYSCVPQPPRSESEEAVFRQGLQYLNSIQILGRTMVLLDDVEDYVSRAWCTLEAINADQFQSIDVMIGSQRKTGHKGLIEYFFDNLLQDRPHIVWRGVLDTEVFRLQTPIECMRRLGLKTTDERDLPYIYSNLCKLDAPTKIHVDDSELVTGAFPLPIVDNGESVLWDKDLGVAVQKDEEQNHHRQSLDWTNVLNIQGRWNREDHVNACNVPSFQKFEPETRRPPEEEAGSRCHIAVVGSCEGEAVVFSNWARKHRSDLELLMNTQITSLSWLASDIAPVGHFVYGKLNAVAVEADMYVVLTLSERFVHCNLTRLLTDLFRHAAGKTFAFSVDKAENNVLTLSSAIKQPVDNPKPRLPNKIRLTGTGTRFSSHLGGLFRPTVKQYLVQVKNESEGG